MKNVCSVDLFEIIDEEGKTATAAIITKANATLASAAAYTIPGELIRTLVIPLSYQPFFCDFHHRGCDFNHLCFDLNDHISLNSYLLISLA